MCNNLRNDKIKILSIHWIIHASNRRFCHCPSKSSCRFEERWLLVLLEMDMVFVVSIFMQMSRMQQSFVG